MIKEYLTEFNSRFGNATIGVDNEKLKAVLKNLRRAEKEFDSTKFMVLVVGPVKSGKSTLVNIFARSYVSPTAYEECTARPCIIAKAKKEADYKIRQYRSIGVSSKEQVDAFKSIIDYLRGIAEEDEVKELASWEDIELSEENITANLKINPSETKHGFDSEPLITLLEVKGGKFINDEIVLIDMPGLDGYAVNQFESDTYLEMAKRADFVIFVLGMSAVINDSSKKFLNHLYFGKNAKRPPICLIHNIHEYDHWHHEKERQTRITVQMAVGIEKIANLIGLKENEVEEIKKHSVNLGKVNDYFFRSTKSFHDSHTNSLAEAFQSFEKYEDKLYKYLSEKQRHIKLQNSINEARATSNGSYEDLKEIKNQINNKLIEIKTILTLLNHIPAEIINYNNNYKATSILAEVREEVQQDINLQKWESKVIIEKQSFMFNETSGPISAKKVYLELDRLADSLSRKSGASKGSTLHNSTMIKFKDHWEDQFSSLKNSIETQIAKYSINFEFPHLDITPYVPYIDDNFTSNDRNGWAATMNKLRERANAQFTQFKYEITQEIRVNNFLQSISSSFVGMCREYANKVIESFKELRNDYTNNEGTGILDKEQQKLQADLDTIDKMLLYLKANMLEQ